MKSIQNQYRDLKEGKMSQANFMRNLRMSMPQYVTNVTSFGDAVRILKNKSILTENTNPENQPSEEELAAMVKKMEDEKAGEEAVMAQYDEELNEAKKKEDKVEYSKNQCNPTELRLGIRTELEHGDMELDKAKEIAYKNIAKDPIYYTKLKLSGVEAHPKKVKGEKEVPAKKAKKESAQLVDLVNGMQKVKMPKADEKKKIKESVDEKMYFADMPADPEKYKIVRDSKNYIIKATNADGVEFQKGDVVKTYDGEEIKIAKFEESQGKVKAIYSTGMFFRGIDIDGLEAPKETFRPGVNIGGSFEKMKRSLEEIVRETISEYFDGRDNLVNPLSAEDENNLNEEENLQQFATKIAAQHSLILMPQPLNKAQLFAMYQKEKGNFGDKNGVMTYEPSSKVVNILSNDEKIPEAVYVQFKTDRGGNDQGFETKTFAEKDAQIAYFKNFQIAG
jgi:hypothetical protein